VPVTQLVE